MNVTSLSGGNGSSQQYYYDADGRRIMKVGLDSAAKPISGTEVLYVNEYLEKDNNQKMYRRNYYAGGKLIAVRTFTLLATINDLVNSLNIYYMPDNTTSASSVINSFNSADIMSRIPATVSATPAP